MTLGLREAGYLSELAFHCWGETTQSNAIWEEFIWLTDPDHEEKPGQEFKAGTNIEAVRKRCLLTCSQWRDHPGLPRDRNDHSGSPTSVPNQENVPQTCLPASLIEAFSQLSSSSQRTLACVS